MFIIIDDQQNAYTGETLEDVLENYIDQWGEELTDITWFEATKIEVRLKPVTITKQTPTKRSS